jgi:hypothetical protein
MIIKKNEKDRGIGTFFFLMSKLVRWNRWKDFFYSDNRGNYISSL